MGRTLKSQTRASSVQLGGVLLERRVGRNPLNLLRYANALVDNQHGERNLAAGGQGSVSENGDGSDAPKFTDP